MIFPADGDWASARQALATGLLAPLAASLASDLDRLLPDEEIFIPDEKAMMTRHGGRCPRDGVLLEFDPRSPRLHTCPTCGSAYDNEAHYRWWIMGYQLWLAERAVHAAVLWRLGGQDRYRALAESILAGMAAKYLRYPNADNVLGPTRVFFSTYLESIWLLQVAVALAVLEDGGAAAAGAIVRDRLVEPSCRLIESFNEGDSNRQVWNSAALGAAGSVLARPELLDQALHGPGGLLDHLRDGLLEDGTWYEGENYHLFAHRGLWYLVAMAERAGASLPETLVGRYERAFATPLHTVLPDLTFPARRDSQYRVSLRQWRFAESLELGLARSPVDSTLASGLRAVYADVEPGDTARWRSTAEAERNVPAARLTRADLGWKSLLHALPVVPDNGDVRTTKSALLPAQGLGVVRRDDGRVYVALDYGRHGGGHGHPDRLNLWLVTETTRVFEDVGTGSYVDPSLQWYRSTLAHNAPLIDGHSQHPATGLLRAWGSRDSFAWIDAEVVPATDVLVRRSVVVAGTYLVDRLEWTSTRNVTLDLPWHADGELAGAVWSDAPLAGGSAPADGFPYVAAAECAGAMPDATARVPGAQGRVHVRCSHAWWRATAPGPPGEPTRRFFLVRCVGSRGTIISAWSWRDHPVATMLDQDTLTMVFADGGPHVHRPEGIGWRIETGAGRLTHLAGYQPIATGPAQPRGIGAAQHRRTALVLTSVGEVAPEIGQMTAAGTPGQTIATLRFELGADHYRRSEESWREAGSPAATVVLAATDTELLVEVTVCKDSVVFAPGRSENPLDNEHPDINSDGVQLHVASVPVPKDEAGTRRQHTGTAFEPPGAPVSSWILVPEPGGSQVRVSTTSNRPQPPLSANWRRTPTGYQLLARVGLGTARTDKVIDLAVDVIVNEITPGRQRRRGQIVLSGGRGEWVYLRGDRQASSRLLPVRVRRG